MANLFSVAFTLQAEPAAGGGVRCHFQLASAGSSVPTRLLKVSAKTNGAAWDLQQRSALCTGGTPVVPTAPKGVIVRHTDAAIAPQAVLTYYGNGAAHGGVLAGTGKLLKVLSTSVIAGSIDTMVDEFVSPGGLLLPTATDGIVLVSNALDTVGSFEVYWLEG